MNKCKVCDSEDAGVLVFEFDEVFLCDDCFATIGELWDARLR